MSTPGEPITELDDEYFPIIGRIAAYSARVENIAASVLSELVSHSDWDRVHVLTYGQPVGWVLERIELFHRTKSYTTDLTAAAAGWARTTRIALKKRNEMVHSVWMPGLLPDGRLYGMGTTQSGASGAVAGLREMRAVRDQMERVWQAG